MRILAGQFKGRRLLGPASVRTRPITARVKKSLFDMLGPAIADAVVVDLYCGAGTLGLEAVSRGAARCFLAERSGSVVQRLRRNIGTLGVQDRCVVWEGDVTRKLARWLGGMDERVDIAFVDPPYSVSRQWSWTRARRSLFDPLASVLAPGGVVVLRVHRKVPIPGDLGALALRRTRSYGDMVLALLGASPVA